MSSPTRRQLNRRERRALRHPKAAQAVRERKAALPWRRACAAVRQLVDAGELPPGCGRVMDAMARCHEEHGTGIRDLELLIGYGLAGDVARLAARTKARGEPPRFDGIAEEAGITRRYAIFCVARLVATGLLRRWFGGPNRDYRKNEKPDVRQRPNAAGERRLCVQGIGGSGWANAYTVEGIEDPPPDAPDTPPRPPAAPPSDEQPRPDDPRWRALYEGHKRDRADRQRRRLAEQEQQRAGAGRTRGP